MWAALCAMYLACWKGHHAVTLDIQPPTTKLPCAAIRKRVLRAAAACPPSLACMMTVGPAGRHSALTHGPRSSTRSTHSRPSPRRPSALTHGPPPSPVSLSTHPRPYTCVCPDTQGGRLQTCRGPSSRRYCGSWRQGGGGGHRHKGSVQGAETVAVAGCAGPAMPK